MLRMESISREFPSGTGTARALHDVNLSVECGELVAVTGPSGSGKSTLLAIAGGLDQPSSGAVHVDGSPLMGLSATGLARLRRDHVGYVFQNLNLLADLTAIENVALPRELAGVRVREARRQAREVLERVNLLDLADRFPDQLSGGEQQRVAIARALVGERKLVLADEPTGALDTENGDHVLALLRTTVQVGTAVVLVTHERRLAQGADRVIQLLDGRLVSS